MRQVADSGGDHLLLCAVLLAAAKDASKGDVAARDWLAGDGAELADDLGICEPYVVRAWAASPGPLPKLSELDKK